MTKYQRGEAMEGWNDCPLPMLAGGGGGRARKRTSRAINLRRIIHANPAVSPESALASTSAPPLPPADVSKEIVDSKLRIVAEKFQLKDNETDLIRKLSNFLEALNPEELRFLDGILGSLLANPPPVGLDGQISHYMMKTGKESDWCMSLSTLVKDLRGHSY